MKNKKLISAISLILMMCIVLGACGKKEEKKETTDNKRTITDLAGNSVTIPKAEDIKKVVIIAPPLPSTYLATAKDTSKIMAMNEMSFFHANQEIINKLVPNRKDINTTMISGGGATSQANVEELMKINPDVILLWGEGQRKGLENIDIPIVDFFTKSKNNEVYTTETDKLMRDVFEVKGEQNIAKEWKVTNDLLKDKLANVKDGEQKKALMIMNNTGEAITVRAKNTHGDDWLVRSGLTNVAGEMEGGDTCQVTMEQIYQWDPDVIFLFWGIDDSKYLDNSIKGQDWSQLTAFKNKKIMDMPIGVINWGFPGSDAPLTAHWIGMQGYPEKFDEKEFKERLKEYYKTAYNLELSEELMNQILSPAKKPKQ